jgi:hypothetical protein
MAAIIPRFRNRERLADVPDRIAGTGALALWILLAMAAFAEPALANKFETIGGGVSGSMEMKREWLQILFLVAGGSSLLGAILAIFVPHRNALLLNYSNWKQSAVVLGVMSLVFFGLALII